MSKEEEKAPSLKDLLAASRKIDHNIVEGPARPAAVFTGATRAGTAVQGGEGEEDLNALTVAELKARLEAEQIEIPKGSKKGDLVELLQQHLADQGEEGEDEEESEDEEDEE